jgi:hypothetical protein
MPGQSPIAIGRGVGFEKLLRANDYAATRELLRGLPGFPDSGARVVSLRNGYPKDSITLPMRAADTRTSCGRSFGRTRIRRT